MADEHNENEDMAGAEDSAGVEETAAAEEKAAEDTASADDAAGAEVETVAEDEAPAEEAPAAEAATEAAEPAEVEEPAAVEESKDAGEAAAAEEPVAAEETAEAEAVDDDAPAVEEAAGGDDEPAKEGSEAAEDKAATVHTYDELKAMTVVQMREIAEGMGEHDALHGYTTMHKEELLVALCKAQGLEAHEHHEVVGIDKAAVKAKIRALKQQREALIEAKDAKQLKIVRRRIRGLKRKIHKATV